MAGRSLPEVSDRWLDEAARTPKPVYVFVGDPLEIDAAARQLIDRLVPPERRAFNFERYDGRATPLEVALDAARTPALFAGRKVVWIQEPPVLAAGERRPDFADECLAALRAGRREAAAGPFLTLLALAGWSTERLRAADWTALPDREFAVLFGRALEPPDRALVAALAAELAERGVRVSPAADAESLLDRYLDAPPEGAVLLLTARTADRRKRLVRRLGQLGVVRECTLARDRTGSLTRESIDHLVDRVVGGAGKRVDPAARALLHQRAGGDPGVFRQELEKLVSYVGDRPRITAQDAAAVVRDLAASWVFDFTRALSRQDAPAALELLHRLLAQGEPPLRLLALIGRELRHLLLAAEGLAGPLRGRWNPRMSFADFRDTVLPRLPAALQEAFGSLHPYACFQYFQQAAGVSPATLRRTLLHLHALDLRLKRSGGDPQVLLDAFLLEFCRPGAGPGSPPASPSQGSPSRGILVRSGERSV